MAQRRDYRAEVLWKTNPCNAVATVTQRERSSPAPPPPATTLRVTGPSNTNSGRCGSPLADQIDVDVTIY